MVQGNSDNMIFPPPDSADEDGVVAVSQDLNTVMLMEAYSRGIFPWPVEANYILWFSPDQRAILEIDDFVVTNKVSRELRKHNFSFSINRHFDEVIRNCAVAKRSDGGGTWITPNIIRAYQEFHRQGYAWSFETLNADGKLVGGLYGIKIGQYFAGESMFYHESGASKFALIETVNYLKNECGMSWIDGQVINPFLSRFGFKEIPRQEFLNIIIEPISTQ
ncbi:MAG: leucyl/phenylalanyl-tRNA--protein transferase [Victivallaceae bacterium]|nr:leucyl/phenylalanyl-tRNA--protein transferase [Victivallaceae bacterium]